MEPHSVRTRTTLLAAAGPCAALMIMASALVAVPGTDALTEDRAAMGHLLDQVATARDRTALAGLITIAAVLLLVPFVSAVAHAIQHRGAAFATWGAAMTATGLMCAAVTNYFWFNNVQATAPALADDRRAMTDFAVEGHWSLAVLGIGEIALMPMGWILLATGLGRSGIVPRWQAVVLGTSLFVALILPDQWATLGGLILLVATLLLFRTLAPTTPTTTEDAPSGPRTTGDVTAVG